MRALRAQINPHFLFNALTTIGYLIQTAPPRAFDTLMRLTSLLRGVLRSEAIHDAGARIDMVGRTSTSSARGSSSACASGSMSARSRRFAFRPWSCSRRRERRQARHLPPATRWRREGHGLPRSPETAGPALLVITVRDSGAARSLTGWYPASPPGSGSATWSGGSRASTAMRPLTASTSARWHGR